MTHHGAEVRGAYAPERTPVSTVAELRTLDDAEIIEGYRDGRDGEMEPGQNRSKSYWHGWRNGMMDSGRLPQDGASTALVNEAVASGYLEELSGLSRAEPIHAPSNPDSPTP